MVHPPGWQPPGSEDPPSEGWGPAYGPPPGHGPPPGWAPPPAPGVVPLRPLGLGDLLDGAVRTMRHNPPVMFGLSALVMGIAVVISTALLLVGLPQFFGAVDTADYDAGFGDLASAVAPGLVIAVLVPAVMQWLALAVLNGVLISAVSDAVIGRRPTVGEVLRRVGWGGAGRLLALTLLTAAALLAVLLLIAAPVAALYVLAVPAGVIATVVGVPVAIAAMVFLTIRFTFAAPAMLLERLGVVTAMRRSWRLGTGSWWRVLGVVLLTGLISWLTSTLLQVPFSIIGQLVGAAMGLTGGESSVTGAVVVSSVITNLGAVVAAAVVSPFGAAVVSLLYIDLRIRREGLDVALARAAARP